MIYSLIRPWDKKRFSKGRKRRVKGTIRKIKVNKGKREQF